MDQLLRGQMDKIYAVCRRMARNEADAMDAAQEALLAVARRIHKFEGRSSFSTWVYRVATNACLDELRRRGRRPEPGLPEHRPIVDPAPAFDERLADRDRLSAALAELPEEFKAPLVLRDVSGMDYAEIAATLDIPPGTVRSRIARARGRLADALSTTDYIESHESEISTPSPEPDDTFPSSQPSQ